MSQTSDEQTGDIDVQGLLGVARYHREHERFHSMNGLEEATELRRQSNALKVLADRWIRAEDSEHGAQVDYSDARFQAAGCPDLNDLAAVATTGILFMEGEREPAELTQLKAKLHGLASGFANTSRWLAEKMDAGWERERAILRPGYARAAHGRFMALTRTTLAGAKFGVIARLLETSVATLERQDLTPAGIRKDRRGNAELLRTVGWLLDRAAALMAEQAAELSLSDPDWTIYIESLEQEPGSEPYE